MCHYFLKDFGFLRFFLQTLKRNQALFQTEKSKLPREQIHVWVLLFQRVVFSMLCAHVRCVFVRVVRMCCVQEVLEVLFDKLRPRKKPSERFRLPTSLPFCDLEKIHFNIF